MRSNLKLGVVLRVTYCRRQVELVRVLQFSVQITANLSDAIKQVRICSLSGGRLLEAFVQSSAACILIVLGDVVCLERENNEYD